MKHLALALVITGGCIQSVHGEGSGGPPPPGGEVRILEERPRGARGVAFGDRVRVDFGGRYDSGEVWGSPLTFIVGPGSHPARPVREPADGAQDSRRLPEGSMSLVPP